MPQASPASTGVRPIATRPASAAIAAKVKALRPGASTQPEVIAGLRAANARLRELLAEKDVIIARLRAQVAKVAEREARVEALAAQVKQNSKNSNRPPSSDGLAKPAPRSLREKTGRKPGRTKGQPGATMQLTDTPDHVVRHEPTACAGCGRGLAGAPQNGVERRQVTEAPAVIVTVIEQQLVEREWRHRGDGRRRYPAVLCRDGGA